MATGKARSSKKFDATKKKDHGHVKDVRRAAEPGREEQGLGTGGRPGGTKSSGGNAGHPKGSAVAKTKASSRSAGESPWARTRRSAASASPRSRGGRRRRPVPRVRRRTQRVERPDAQELRPHERHHGDDRSVPRPPSTTEAWVPTSEATAPLSNAPNSFERPMKT